MPPYIEIIKFNGVNEKNTAVLTKFSQCEKNGEQPGIICKILSNM
jgi:hypothetical protein